MRRIRYYVFKAGAKLPFAELPAVIHQFLDEQGLKSASYLYYFEALEFEGSVNPCRRIYKDIPMIGEPKLVKQDGTYDRQVITNMAGKPDDYSAEEDNKTIRSYSRKLKWAYEYDNSESDSYED